MKRLTLISILMGLVLAALGAAGGYWFAMRRAHTDPAAPTPGKSEPAAGRRVLYWHDPMTPGPKFDKPGKSPFMNMDLVPVYADEAASDGKVTISARTAQNLGIRIVEVKQSHMPGDFVAAGAVSVA